MVPGSRWLLAALVAALLAGSTHARGQGLDTAEPTLFVAWQAPANCPDREIFISMLQSHSGTASMRPAHVQVEIVQRRRRFYLTMRSTSAGVTGERKLTGRDCAVLAETAALTLALSLTPAAPPASPRANTEPSAAPLDSENPPVPPAPVSSARSRSSLRSDSEDSLQLAIRGLVGGDFGSFPDASTGFGGALAVELGANRVEAFASIWPEQLAASRTNPDEGVALSSVAAGLRACRRLLGNQLRTALCAGAEMARTRARGIGLVGATQTSWYWPYLLGGGAIAFRINGRMEIRADFELLARPFKRPRFGLADGSEIFHRPAWVSARASAGFELSFP